MDSNMTDNKGMLYLVATPIGNLEDMTYRAVRVLNEVDLIAAEDTRNTVKLLNHYDISTKLTSYHEHNKHEKGLKIIDRLLQGDHVALVSDAGTPGISDPGEDLVSLAYQNNIKVTMLPGCVAGIMALVLSALPASTFCFEGFLPVQNKDRKKRLMDIEKETRTMIFYEAPHRLKKTIQDLFDALGDRKIALARELTKKYEEIELITLAQAAVLEKEPRGEYVIVVEGIDENIMHAANILEWEKISIASHYEMYLKEGMDRKEAMKKVASDRGMMKRDVYKQIVEGE